MTRPWVGVDGARWIRLGWMGMALFLLGLIPGGIAVSYADSLLTAIQCNPSIPRRTEISGYLETAILLVPCLLISSFSILLRGPRAGRIEWTALVGSCPLVTAFVFGSRGFEALFEYRFFDLSDLLLDLFQLLCLAAVWSWWWGFDVVRREHLLTRAMLEEVDAQREDAETQRLDVLWERMGSRETGALERLLEKGGEAVAFLASRLHPANDDGERIRTLIAALANPARRKREEAASELENLGKLAEPALRKALDASPEGEFRFQLERTLRSLKDPRRHLPETRRRLKALEALGQIGTPAAREILEALARGAPEALLTEQAKMALARMPCRNLSAAERQPPQNKDAPDHQVGCVPGPADPAGQLPGNQAPGQEDGQGEGQARRAQEPG